MGSALLPPSIRDARTVALADLLDRLAELPLGLLRHLHNPALCPAEALPYLARAYGVLEAAWGLAGSEAEQRALVGQALLWQRHRGTPWALSQVLSSVGWPGGVIEERLNQDQVHDGAIRRRGSHFYGGVGSWASFRVRFDLGNRALTPADVALFRLAVDGWSPVGCWCAELLLRLVLAGGLAPGHTASEVVSLRAGTAVVPIDGLESGRVTASLRRREAPDEDLRVFELLNGAGVVVAQAQRDIQLIHHDHTLLIDWSL